MMVEHKSSGIHNGLKTLFMLLCDGFNRKIAGWIAIEILIEDGDEKVKLKIDEIKWNFRLEELKSSKIGINLKINFNLKKKFKNLNFHKNKSKLQQS